MSEAVLELRYRRILVLAPVAKQTRYPPLMLTVLHATERDAPKGRDKIDGKLVTDLPIRSRKERSFGDHARQNQNQISFDPSPRTQSKRMLCVRSKPLPETFYLTPSLVLLIGQRRLRPHMTQGPFKNGLLQRFDSETIGRLDLKAVDLPVNRAIEFPGNRIEDLFFIEEGMASMTTTFDDGSQVEVGLAGWEFVQGASVLMGTKKSLNRVYMQVAGHGYSTTTDLAADEFKRCSVFQDLTLRYLQAQVIQSAQTAGCNARHSVQQRLARWLLLCADRNGGRILPLSHEYMADMLGSNRSTVTVIAGQFQSLNLIQYTRGKINLVDLPGLEKMACECYRVVRDHLTNLTEYDQGIRCTEEVSATQLKTQECRTEAHHERN